LPQRYDDQGRNDTNRIKIRHLSCSRGKMHRYSASRRPVTLRGNE
jgi:hypothetical protein